MSEDVDKQPEAEPEDEGPRCGELLLAARESLSISIGEIAKELHIDEQKVAALEKNDFSTLGAPVFAKGHLRKYAQLVKVDPNDVLADYHRLTRSEGLPPVVSDRKAPKLPASPTPWIVSIIVILIAAGAAAVYWYFSRPEAPPAAPATLPELSEEDVSDARESLPPPATMPVAEAVADAIDEPLTDVPAEERPAPAPQPVADDIVRLTVSFSGDCWTEITDGDGRRLFFDLGRDGRTINLSGPEPLSVLFGNAANVELNVNGSSYDIPASGRRGQTARFRLFATP